MAHQPQQQPQQPPQQQKMPMTGAPQGQTGGVSNVEFDLYAEIHSLLKGNQALDHYLNDARQAGDADLESCFQQIRDQNQQHVDKLRGMIAKRISKPS